MTAFAPGSLDDEGAEGQRCLSTKEITMPLISKECLNRIVHSFKLSSPESLRSACTSQRTLGTDIWAMNAKACGLDASGSFQPKFGKYSPVEQFHALQEICQEIVSDESPLADLLRKRRGEVSTEIVLASPEYHKCIHAA